MEKIEVFCTSCDADFKLYHNLDEPYVLTFCAFCGEEIEEEELDVEELE